MKKLLLVQLLFISSLMGYSQNNIIDPSTWSVGTGSAPGFSRLGTDAENVREIGVNPHGDNAVLWKAVPDAANNGDGGWNGSWYNIDHTKNYRFSVWIKKTNSSDGRTYFGLYTRDGANVNATLDLDGAPRSNAYFWYGDLPVLDKWYLLIGYINNSGHTGQTVRGGVYDPVSGVKVVNGIRDFKFSNGAARLKHRAYLFYDTNTNDRQFYWNPTVYEENGQEPTIPQMLNPGTTPGGGDTVWETSGNDINYIAGNVGIKTTSPDEALTVKGKIHAEEVRVDLSVPAPDYVFKSDYELKTLEEVQNYIDKHGHLPNIPSALKMETEGVELGTMEMKLLEKIEELTLYMLQLKQENKNLQKDNVIIKKQLKKIQKKHQ
ncbi:hypothetical protein [Maribacter sp. 2308TA10-17]|uniref:hypothetical protein n=1 Tax=Maribacter sp. 2308TA10-17 TaxID=3386276 RepID=UPI0039BCDEAC